MPATSCWHFAHAHRKSHIGRQEIPEGTSNSIYIASVSMDATEEDVVETFKGHTTVNIKVGILDAFHFARFLLLYCMLPGPSLEHFS